jgi:hypothetical protein
VLSREEAIKEGWFGPVGGAVSDSMAARIGDVVAACAGSWAVVASRAEPLETSLTGMHGSLTADALGESERMLVVAYHGDLDSNGHRYGVGSPAWVNQLSHVDKLAEQIAGNLPHGSAMYVTADHGMVNVGPDDRVDVDAAGSPLREGVALLGGEPRARHVYARPGAADDVLATWREVLGDRAWVMSRAEAIKDGWFGPPGVAVSDAIAGRIGDVIVAGTGNWAVVATKADPHEASLIGMHGSLTQAEQLVPLLTPGWLNRISGPSRPAATRPSR